MASTTSTVQGAAIGSGREAPRGEALMLVSVDDPIPAAVVERLRATARVLAVKVVKL